MPRIDYLAKVGRALARLGLRKKKTKKNKKVKKVTISLPISGGPMIPMTGENAAIPAAAVEHTSSRESLSESHTEVAHPVAQHAEAASPADVTAEALAETTEVPAANETAAPVKALSIVEVNEPAAPTEPLAK